MMIIAFNIAQLLGTGNSQKKCISIECGLQNGTLAIFVGTTLFGGGEYVVPAATYSLIMFATSLIFVFLLRRILLNHLVDALLPKKNFLKSLSIPTTSKPLSQKKFTDSEPTNPLEPVIKTTDIINIFLKLFYYF